MRKNFKQIFLVIFIILFTSMPSFAQVLEGYAEKVPNAFYGTWRVVSKLENTNSKETFKQKGLDLWNLSTTNGVINLSNPFSGASAEITIKDSSYNTVKFIKESNYKGDLLTDTVVINLNGESFTGYNIITLDSNGQKIYAKYSLKGEKIAGMSILGE